MCVWIWGFSLVQRYLVLSIITIFEPIKFRLKFMEGMLSWLFIWQAWYLDRILTYIRQEIKNYIAPSLSGARRDTLISISSVTNKQEKIINFNFFSYRLREHMDNLWHLIGKKGAHVYVRAHHMFSRILKFTFCNCFFDKNNSYIAIL